MTTGRGDGGRTEALELATEVYRRARGAVRRTPGLLAVSLVLGISLWVFVADTENPTLVDAFPQPITVEAVNVGESLAVANQLPTITARVAAASDRWERLSAANFRAFVDLNGFGARSQEVPLQVEVVDVSGVRVVDTSPRVITVNLENQLTNKVPVTTRAVGQLPIGYELGPMMPQVSIVSVRGAESLVALVSEAVAEINVTGLTAGVEPGVNLKPVGAGGGEIRGVRIEPQTVKVGVQVIQSTIVRTVPLTVDVTGVPDTGYRVSSVTTSPATVQIQGAVQTIQAIDRITLPAVDVAGARADIARSIAIPLPAGVTAVGAPRATVTVTVAQVGGAQRTTFGIAAQNVPQGLTARFATPTLEVVLNGPIPALNALLPEDVRVTVDVAGRAAGTYTLPVRVQPPEGITVGFVQATTVEVTISAP
ncbi:MAG: CdaR family protein [Chloroflexi bacterium]|nr:CdaR family protein [Chloroflexota bacterium]